VAVVDQTPKALLDGPVVLVAVVALLRVQVIHLLQVRPKETTVLFLGLEMAAVVAVVLVLRAANNHKEIMAALAVLVYNHQFLELQLIMREVVVVLVTTKAVALGALVVLVAVVAVVKSITAGVAYLEQLIRAAAVVADRIIQVQIMAVEMAELVLLLLVIPARKDLMEERSLLLEEILFIHLIHRQI